VRSPQLGRQPPAEGPGSDRARHGWADYGYWGFSPASDPFGGYREYGVDPIGMEPNGYTSDKQRTLVDPGWADPADPDCARAPSTPAAYGDGVVTPHAAFLALP